MPFSFTCTGLTRSIVTFYLSRRGFPCRTRIGLALASGRRVRQVGLRCHRVSHPASILSFPVLSCRGTKSFSFLRRRDRSSFGPSAKRIVLKSVVVSISGILRRTRDCKRDPGHRFTFLVMRDVLRLFNCSRVSPGSTTVVRPGRGRVLRRVRVMESWEVSIFCRGRVRGSEHYLYSYRFVHQVRGWEVKDSRAFVRAKNAYEGYQGEVSTKANKGPQEEDPGFLCKEISK